MSCANSDKVIFNQQSRSSLSRFEGYRAGQYPEALRSIPACRNGGIDLCSRPDRAPAPPVSPLLGEHDPARMKRLIDLNQRL